ncbi:hypothetical protein LS70_003335 [Helicobacter sp. MIT 11-5569]|uniref:formyltransferase family protein n=1 Tax=Helicobacter sp. MIT 11-5569 TaxID=1548151 RepID=UPI00051F90B9|nr:formyltransferase family protein [Helicobacter sp. MIT 11-5569]TLD84593.1 hypothetical protein LS70_003335 [Helicobacter sp. MIT 11-5569]
MNIAFFCTGNGSFFKFIYHNKDLLERVDRILLFSDRNCGVIRDFKDLIPCEVFDSKDFEKDALEWLLKYEVEYVFLSCNRILKYELLEYFGEDNKKMFNTHPSLLPKYIGLSAIKDSFESHDKVYGATIHYVTKEVDCGGIVARCALKRSDSDLSDYTHRLFINQAVLYLDFVSKVSLGEDFKVLEGFNVNSSLGFTPSLTLDCKRIKFFNPLDSQLLIKENNE